MGFKLFQRYQQSQQCLLLFFFFKSKTTSFPPPLSTVFLSKKKIWCFMSRLQTKISFFFFFFPHFVLIFLDGLPTLILAKRPRKVRRVSQPKTVIPHIKKIKIKIKIHPKFHKFLTTPMGDIWAHQNFLLSSNNQLGGNFGKNNLSMQSTNLQTSFQVELSPFS